MIGVERDITDHEFVGTLWRLGDRLHPLAQRGELLGVLAQRAQLERPTLAAVGSMRKADAESTTAQTQSLTKPQHQERYLLRLYVTGLTPRSTEAFAAIKAICEEHLQGNYDLEVIDIYQNPALAKDEQIIAVPTLVKKLPAPLRRLIGNLAAEERVLLGLDLRRKTDETRD